MTHLQEIWQFLSTFWIIPLVAILFRAGGKGGFTGARYLRKTLMWVVIALYAYLYTKKWTAFLIIPAGFGVGSLPLTLKGDSVKDAWYNWLWIPVVGLLEGLTFLTLDFHKWKLALLFAVASAGHKFFTLSFENLSGELKHRQYELWTGIMLGTFAWISVFGGIAQ